MGANLTLNFHEKGFKTYLYDVDPNRLNVVCRLVDDLNCTGFFSVETLLANFTGTKVILILIQAGSAIDTLIDSMEQFLLKGDIIIDGGNSYFEDTDRRFSELKDVGIE